MDVEGRGRPVYNEFASLVIFARHDLQVFVADPTNTRLARTRENLPREICHTSSRLIQEENAQDTDFFIRETRDRGQLQQRDG